ncbi:MAG: tetratricopeptide repeat protein [Saprospiraceae bacterium]
MRSFFVFLARTGCCWLLFFSAPVIAAGTFEFSPLARDAYRKAFSLRFGEAAAALAELRKREPNNHITPLVENHLDFMTVLVNDDQAEYKRLAQNMEPRLARLARGDRKSPWYLFSQAEVRLQWAVLHGKHNAYLSGLSDIKQAYALLEQNNREHPGFAPNLKSLGIIHALVGAVPEEYRWTIRAMSGISGTVEQGMGEIREALAYAQKHDFVFEDETRVACAFLQINLANERTEAWKIISSGGLDPAKNPVATFAMASLAMRTGRNDEAVRLLEACPEGGAYHPFLYRHFLLGMAKLHRLDPDADKPLLAFLKNFKGENGIKEVYQKLAWHHLAKGDETGYLNYINMLKTKGNDRSEADKAALEEARRGEVPDVRLLRARLLFDGGYYQRAHDLLRDATGTYSGKLALELEYRLGRIAHELGKATEAERRYEQTIEKGRKNPAHFACNAALQLGLLHEEKGSTAKAKAAFERCLELQPEDYRASLHAKAKAGLSRLAARG